MMSFYEKEEMYDKIQEFLKSHTISELMQVIADVLENIAT